MHAGHGDLDAVMDRVLRVSSATGSMGPARPDEELGRWAYVAGERCHGRFARHSLRNGTATDVDAGTTDADGESGGKAIGTMDDDGQLAIEVDVQVMQLTLKASHPQALPEEVSQLPDVKHVFGNVTMQACLTEQTA